MFIKIVPTTDKLASSIIYEGDDIRAELFVVTETSSRPDGYGEYVNLLREQIPHEYFYKNRESWDWYETALIWFKCKTGESRIIEAPLSMVYIMNDSGKTVDKIDASSSSLSNDMVSSIGQVA